MFHMDHGKTVENRGKPWKTMGKPWETIGNHRKTIGNRKMMGKPWENRGLPSGTRLHNCGTLLFYSWVNHL